MDLGRNLELKSDKWNTGQKVSQPQAVATKTGRKDAEWEVWSYWQHPFSPERQRQEYVYLSG